jgi:hypothetical protein
MHIIIYWNDVQSNLAKAQASSGKLWTKDFHWIATKKLLSVYLVTKLEMHIIIYWNDVQSNLAKAQATSGKLWIKDFICFETQLGQKIILLWKIQFNSTIIQQFKSTPWLNEWNFDKPVFVNPKFLYLLTSPKFRTYRKLDRSNSYYWIHCTQIFVIPINLN